MTSISQALNDIQKYLEIDDVKDVRVTYDVTDENYKEVRLTFTSNGAGFQVVATKISVRK
jgi:hypothetical protein|tara:strand:- start:413 stop:592 length:180 start_codon:yes stop_codon:yes gene_type:complete